MGLATHNSQLATLPQRATPLRALFVTTTYPLAQGDSIPAFVADLAQSLVKHHGIQVKVIAPHRAGSARYETVNGVEIERFQYALDPAQQCVAYGGGIPDNLRNFPRAKFQLPAFFTAMAAAVWRNLHWADLIHAHWIEPAFLSMLANHLHRPLVISVHSLKPRRSRLHAWTLKRADRVLFNSRYTLSQAADKGYACRGQVIYQGYDEALFGTGAVVQPGGEKDSIELENPVGEESRHRNVELHQCRQSLGISDDATLIVALGRMIEVKGLHILAGAADAILANRPNVHLVIAGDGPQRPEIQRIVDQAASRGRIHLTGALPRAEVARLLAAADLFINPGVIDSRGRAEGLGITTLEAMASGLPVIGSRVGGITETILDHQTGLLVPPGDPSALASAVNDLLEDPARRAQFGIAASEFARRNFTWPILAGQVARVYREVME